MKVSFSVGLDLDPQDEDLTYFDETTVMRDIATYRNDIIQQYELGYERGCFIIALDDDNKVEIPNELQYSVISLSFLAVSKLVNGEAYHFQYYSSPSQIVFTPNDETVSIAGAYVNSITVPRREFIRECYRCGERYIEFLRLLDAEQYAFTIKQLQDYAAEAKLALDKLEHQ